MNNVRTPAAGIDRMRGDLDIDQRAILLTVPPQAGVADIRFAHLGNPLHQPGYFLRRANVGYAHRQEFFAAVAIVRHRRVVHREEHQGFEVEYPHRSRIPIEQIPVAHLPFVQRLVGPLALGDVLNRAHGLGQSSIRIEGQFGAAVHPTNRLTEQYAVLEFVGRAFERGARGLVHRVPVIRMHKLQECLVTDWLAVAQPENAPGLGRPAHLFRGSIKHPAADPRNGLGVIQFRFARAHFGGAPCGQGFKFLLMSLHLGQELCYVTEQQAERQAQRDPDR